MFKLQLDKKKLELILVSTLAVLLTVTFSISLILGVRDAKNSDKLVSADEIEYQARLFLPDKPNCTIGKRLDCSSYTRQVYRQFSLNIPSSSGKQYESTERVIPEDLRKGDLVFFNTNGRGVSHVGIYLDNKAFIHSPGKNKDVRIDSLTQNYYKNTFISGGRITFDTK